MEPLKKTTVIELLQGGLILSGRDGGGGGETGHGYWREFVKHVMGVDFGP